MKAKILYITAAGEKGGAEVVLLRILRFLNRDRYEPYVACLSEGPFVQELKQEANAEMLVLPAGRFRNIVRGLKTIHALRHFIQVSDCKLVHCNGTAAHLYGAYAASLARVPSLYHVHDALEWSWSGQGVVNAFAARMPSMAAVAVSRYVADTVQPKLRSPITVIYNGLEIPTNGHTQAPRSDGRLHVVWCGRLQRWKGAHVFIQAAAQVKARVPSVVFSLVGGSLFGLEPEYEKELHAMTRAYDLDSSLTFTGFQSDPLKFLDDADLVVSSSILPEPFSLVCLESMALGKPVIASSEGGTAETILNRTTGVLVPPNNPAKLAEAMIELLENRSMRLEMGSAGRLRAEKEFGIPRMMNSLENVYSDLLAGRS